MCTIWVYNKISQHCSRDERDPMITVAGNQGLGEALNTNAQQAMGTTTVIFHEGTNKLRWPDQL